MPTINKSRVTRTGSISNTPQPQDFAFPSSHHLNVTTSEHVRALNQAETRIIFKSNTCGIVAAAESPDGTGTLAVSDSQNVILHQVQVEHGLERSYRLRGSEGQIRYLQFSTDSKILYFTTTLLNAVQAYSLADCALLDPGPLHASIPVAVAISARSKLLLSASQQPPSLYIQNRTLGLEPLLLQPRVSEAPIALACFHPDREDIFLLAFQDGTIAAYDATRAARRCPGSTTSSQALCKELYAFRNLHATSSKASIHDSDGADASPWSLTVTGASFIPRSKSRAISAGADGRCRILDFGNRSIVFSWHVRAPITALSLLCLAETSDTVVAIGKQDGKVAIYDTSGCRKQEVNIGEGSAPPIIGVEWIRGDIPIVTGLENKTTRLDETCIELFAENGTLRSRKTKSSDHDTYDQATAATVGQRTSLQYTTQQHEQQLGTVYFRPSEHDASLQLPNSAELNYMDLFSPLRPTHPPPTQSSFDSPRRNSSPRNRPRLSSTTFVSNVHKDASPKEDIPASKSKFVEILDRSTTQVSYVDPRSMFQSNSVLFPARTVTMTSSKERGGAAMRARRGNLALFAPYLPQIKSLKTRRNTNTMRQPVGDSRSAQPQLSPRKRSTKQIITAEQQHRAQGYGQDDIWLTAESEDEPEESDNDGIQRTRTETLGRRILWPSERQKRQQTLREEIAHRPSIELRMSAPVAKTLGKAQSKSQKTNAKRPRSKNVACPSSSPTAKAKNESSTTSLMTISSDEHGAQDQGQLEPGFAQSFHGPVSVNTYLPRRSSLAVPTSPSPTATKQSNKATDTEHGKPHTDELERTQGSFHVACIGCANMKEEMADLRCEVAELRRLVKGKAQAP